MHRSASSLTELDLSSNLLRGQGACAVARGLRNNSSLKRLHLGWNTFGKGKPMTELRSALSKRQATLTDLDLRYNSISVSTAHILAEGLKHNTSLRALTLDGNMLMRGGASDIHDALQRDEEDTVQVSMHDCGISGKLSHDFDPSEPAGDYCLNLEDAYDLKMCVLATATAACLCPCCTLLHAHRLANRVVCCTACTTWSG